MGSPRVVSRIVRPQPQGGVQPRIDAEVVNYVCNIYKYYVAYKLVAVQEEQRRKARESFQEKLS